MGLVVSLKVKNQHAEYVKHTEKVMKEENERIREKEREYEKWEEKLEKLKERENDEIKKNQEGLEKYKKQLSQRQQCNTSLTLGIKILKQNRAREREKEKSG